VFLNDARNSGSILSLAGRLRIESSNTDCYIKWRKESSIDFDSGKYKHIDKAAPFYVEGKSSIHKVLWFYIDIDQPLFINGDFSVTVYGWQNRTSQPDFESVKHFGKSSDLEEIMNDRKQNSDPSTQILKLNGTSPRFIKVASNIKQDWSDQYFGP